MTRFSTLFDTHCKRAGASNQALATALNLPPETIAAWRTGGTTRPSRREQVVELATLLHLDPEETSDLLLAAGFSPEQIQLPDWRQLQPTKPISAEFIAHIQSSPQSKPRRWSLWLMTSLMLVVGLGGTLWLMRGDVVARLQPVNGASAVGIQPAEPGEALEMVGQCLDEDMLTTDSPVAIYLQREAATQAVDGLRVVALDDVESAVAPVAIARAANATMLVTCSTSAENDTLTLDWQWLQPRSPSLIADQARVVGSQTLPFSSLSETLVQPVVLILLGNVLSAQEQFGEAGSLFAQAHELVVSAELAQASAQAACLSHLANDDSRQARPFCDELNGHQPAGWLAKSMLRADEGDWVASAEALFAFRDAANLSTAEIDEWAHALAVGIDPFPTP